jgi:hypothetical protein
MQFDCSRRCHAITPVDFSYTGTQRADVTAPLPEAPETLSDQPGYGGFSIRSRDPDNVHRFAGVAVESVCDFTKMLTKTINWKRQYVSVRRWRCRRSRIPRNRRCAGANCVVSVVKAMMTFAAARKEQIAPTKQSAVTGDTAYGNSRRISKAVQ